MTSTLSDNKVCNLLHAFVVITHLGWSRLYANHKGSNNAALMLKQINAFLYHFASTLLPIFHWKLT